MSGKLLQDHFYKFKLMQRNYKLLIFSFIALNLFNWISVVEGKFGIPSIVKYVLSILVLLTIIYNKISTPSKLPRDGLFHLIIVFFLGWSLILVVSSLFRFDSLFYLQRIMADPYFFIPYFLPIFILLTKYELDFFKLYFYYTYILLIAALIIQIFIIGTSLSQAKWAEQVNLIYIFDIGSSFLLFTAHISKKKYISFLVIFYAILMIYLFSFYGRRGSLIEYMILLIVMIIIRLRSPFLKLNDRIKMYYVGLLIIIMSLTVGYSLLTSSYAFQRGFTKEAAEESRGTVVEDFFSDFTSNKDLVFGRGLLGTVYRSNYMDNESADFIENGFLTVLLKGGFLYLISFVLILLRAIYLGFYKSNNDLVKALASFLVVYLIMMFYFNLPVYTTKYIFMWIAVTACFTSKIRNATNVEIYVAINS